MSDGRRFSGLGLRVQGVSLQSQESPSITICVYIYMCMCVCIYIYICACIYVCIGTCIDSFLQTCPAFARAPLYSEWQQFELRWTLKLMHDPKYFPSWELQYGIIEYHGHAELLLSTGAINLAHALQPFAMLLQAACG